MKKDPPQIPPAPTELLIRVSDVPQRGLPLQGNLSKERLNARLALAEGNDIILLTDPPFDLLVTRQIGGGQVQGHVHITFQQGCGRCLKNVEQKRQVAVEYLLKEQPEPNSAETPFVDDVGVHCYHQDRVDLENLLQEEIILALDPYFSPAVDEGGKCELCGDICDDTSRAPEKRTLGDLLGAALEKGSAPRKRGKV